MSGVGCSQQNKKGYVYLGLSSIYNIPEIALAHKMTEIHKTGKSAWFHSYKSVKHFLVII